MAMAVRLDRLRFGHAGLLAQARQRVILAENGDHRPAFTCLAHDGGRDVGDVFSDAKTLGFQRRRMFGHRAIFRVGDLRHAPDAVAEFDEFGAMTVDDLPDFFGILHGGVSFSWD